MEDHVSFKMKVEEYDKKEFTGETKQLNTIGIDKLDICGTTADIVMLE